MQDITSSTRNNDLSTPPRRRSPLFWIGTIGGVVVAALLALTFFVIIPNNVLSEGNKLESGLSASYVDGANYLSNCVIKTEQAANVAQANADAFDKVIRDAIAGTGAAAHVDTTTTAGRNQLLPILVQAYPDLAGQTALFERVMTTINGCRDDYRNKQTAVLSQVQTFDTWRTGSWTVRTFGSDFPNENLHINLPGLTLTGQAALDKMRAPIVDATTSSSYQTGETPTDGPFNND
jgi:hypothetical protein